MAFSALILNGEGILALVVAASARLALLHVAHAGLDDAGFIRENLGVTVGAFIGLQVELVAEGGFATNGLPGYFTWFHALVALVAVACGSKGILAVVAGAAGCPFDHVIHGRLAGYTLVREYFDVAILAGVCLGMERMAEGRRGCAF